MRRFWTVLCLMLLALPVAAFAQDTAVIDTVVVQLPADSFDFVKFLTAYQLPIATLIGSALVWALTHFWAGFAKLGTPGIGGGINWGDWIKRGCVVVGVFLVLQVLHLMGAQASPVMGQYVSQFWAGLLDALLGGTASAGVFKLATTSPYRK